MFNRYETLKKCIEDKSMDTAVLTAMIDMHLVLKTLTQEEGVELMTLLNPTSILTHPEEVSVEE